MSPVKITLKLIAPLAAGLVALSAFTPAAGAVGTCEFNDTLCVWEKPNYGGERLTMTPLPPNTSACVNLVAHGWGARVKSLINTSRLTASLFASDDCTGRPYPVEGNSGVPSLTFVANSAFVQVDR